MTHSKGMFELFQSALKLENERREANVVKIQKVTRQRFSNSTFIRFLKSTDVPGEFFFDFLYSTTYVFLRDCLFKLILRN